MAKERSVVFTLHQWIEIFMRHSMHNFIRYLRESGFSMAQFGTLFHIQRVGSIGVSDLADDLGVTSAAASQILERLVQQELILRSEDPHDRRGKQIMLTEKGRQITQEGIHAHQDWLNDLEECLSTSEREKVVEALNILIDKASQLGLRPDPNVGKMN
jgi:DNA-binding MarR family transcriptional regulator